MFRRAITVLIGVAAVAALIAGCGDDSSAALTKAEFQKQANAECKRITNRAANELQDYAEKEVKGSTLTKDNQLELIDTVIVPSVRDQIEALESIEPPEADKKTIDALIGELDEIATEAEEDPLAVAKIDSPFEDSEKRAKAYGLRWCGHQ